MTTRHDVYHLNPSFVPRSIVRDGLFLLILRICRRENVLVFFRGWDTSFSRRIARSGIARHFFLLAYGRAARLLVLGSVFANELLNIGLSPSSMHKLTTTFDGELLRQAVRSRVSSEVRILFMARFVAAKGIYELLEAFRRVSRDNPMLSLTMAGDGEEGTNVRAWCGSHGLEDRVSFPGYVRGALKAQLLVDCDIFALPSYHSEGCPNALLEAMGAGLPAIVCATGGIPDIISDGVHGIVVAPRDPDAIESALRKLIENPALRAEMGARNRLEAWKTFEARAVSARLEAHYRSIAGGTEN
jgi:glycosyltransferase involved in cell wall biosynthesis